MTGYLEVALNQMIDSLGEDKVKAILSSFSCPLNKDVEQFLRSKSIEFDKQGISKTHLIFASYKNEPQLVGYFTLANKYITINNKRKLSNSIRKRIRKFGSYNDDLKRFEISAPLIAQLGKNYSNNYNQLISGDELLKIALDNVKKVQQIVGGKFVYLECENKPKLVDFYKDNGFVDMGERKLDRDETGVLQGEYLIQMLRYLKDE